MKISKRLKTICEYVKDGSDVIDIGADHAKTSIYLNKYKNCNCLATDISKEAIKRANINIKKENANVQTKITDGLNELDLTNQILIISGMGAHAIIKILNKKINNDIIISSNNDTHLIRKFMYKKGYHIEKETLIFDKYYYIISYYKYGKKKKIDFVISPFINNKNYLLKQLNYYQIKYNKEKKILKRIKYKCLIQKLKNKIK